MMKTVSRDVVILGGGIAGLWLLRRLLAAGYDAILLERSALGSGQTIASQGMIHGGIKYALGGALNPASAAIAAMPDHWRNCLQGLGDVDLRGTRVLSEHYHLWPAPDIRARVNAFLGSKAVRGRVASLHARDFPAFFQHRITGPLYQLADLVVDVPSLLQVLSAGHEQRIHRVRRPDDIEYIEAAQGGLSHLLIQTRTQTIELQAKRFALMAGAGNQAILQHLKLERPRMQLRPLHMVVLKHHYPDPLYVHCVSGQFSSTPELTITTHDCQDGSVVWYLGGGLAETGVQRDQPSQIAAARQMLAARFPWCRFDDAQWRSFIIQRAEAQQGDGQRPDDIFVGSTGKLLIGWPTKLTLAPALANAVLSALTAQKIRPQRARDAADDALQELLFPGIATSPWDELFR
ncbi:MAG: FAD-dependent oxidoreductase [Pseudomonadales bacterium]|nr:FAD-dependent oxidoreductase [Pseudomonadales bacterium]